MYSVDITNTKDYLFNVRSKDYEFNVDTKGNGITPPDTLLASVGTCLGVYIRKYAEGANIELGPFTIKVESELSKDPACFRKINVKIDLKGFKMDERRVKAMLGFVKNCPVHNTLKVSPEVEIEIV